MRWSATTGGILTESERLAVVVTEMLRLSAHVDGAACRAAKQILGALLNEPDLALEDRRIIQATVDAGGVR